MTVQRSQARSNRKGIHKHNLAPVTQSKAQAKLNTTCTDKFILNNEWEGPNCN